MLILQPQRPQRWLLALATPASVRSFATNGARIRIVALLAAATLARGALGETGDHVAACYSPSTTVALSNRVAAAIETETERRARERANLIAALERSGGKVYGSGGAAELLGVPSTTLASRLRGLGIRRPRRGP